MTFGFDDGLTSQFVQRDILAEHGVKATYFVNSGMVGNANRLSWEQIATLAAEGHEIGGHTVDHVNLKGLDQATQMHQLCDDRTALQAHGATDGYTVRNVAYPFGQWDATTKIVAAGCGYDTGRTTGGTDYPSGPIFAETFPPLNAYTLRAIQPRLNTSLPVWKDIVQKARDSGGGWVDIVMHDLCDLPCTGFDQFSVSTERFEEVLDWLETLPDVKIRTTERALAVGTDATAPVVALTAPADGGTVTGSAVALTAEAADVVGVDHVDFLVDDVAVGSDASAPYAVDWDSSTAGDSATITAAAFDEAGNSTLSAAATVSVSHPVDPPVVDPPVDPPVTNPPVADPPVATPPILDPLPIADTRKPSARIADVVLRGDRLLVIVDAHDAGGIRAVRVQLPGRVVRTDRKAPFTVSWRARAGRHVVAAEAIDRAGNRRRSAPVRVDVRTTRSRGDEALVVRVRR